MKRTENPFFGDGTTRIVVTLSVDTVNALSNDIRIGIDSVSVWVPSNTAMPLYCCVRPSLSIWVLVVLPELKGAPFPKTH